MRIIKLSSTQTPSHIAGLALALAAMTLSLARSARAQTESVLHTFTDVGTDGGIPFSGLTFDSAGNLWGTAIAGGTSGEGEVFELTPAAGGGWTFNSIFGFSTWTSGRSPNGPVVFDSAGNVYGTTMNGGTNFGCDAGQACGNVFELSPTSGGWVETVLYSFTGGVDGGVPIGNLAIDAAGNLYGTTSNGGRCKSSFGCGVVYELSPTSTGWKETVLHSFTGKTDGAFPYGGVIFDSAGNLYGTASSGGNQNVCVATISGCGVVFQLIPSSTGWTEHAIHLFSSVNTGEYPEGGLAFDAAGSLYGTTYTGGGVFKLAPTGTGGWKFTLLKVLQGSGGAGPRGSLTLDASGNIYGTTVSGGDVSQCFSSGCGVVYKLSPTGSGAWRETVLHAFTGGADGRNPYYAGVVRDASGNIYGVTEAGGNLSDCGGPGCGVVFEITP
ncbi:MAG TPA: choice-of-anchor tandem repeat GloVer-containing protein [Candidatus Acidoferrum sp.]|jgi:uncharacterized repeat protein (TIGR03803 family)|nr:choice-of-anchor tandem repeat GloVer-containing protein [Candidatus Acidoferrum sp.]